MFIQTFLLLNKSFFTLKQTRFYFQRKINVKQQILFDYKIEKWRVCQLILFVSKLVWINTSLK